MVASHMHPEQGSNPQPFGVWDDAPTIEATQPELCSLLDVRVCSLNVIEWKTLYGLGHQ